MSTHLQIAVASNFNQATHEEFWHYLAKNKLEDSIYQNATSLQQRIEQIREKLGNCSFDRQAAYGWTPLHVAILSNNPAGVRFFLSKGARVDIQDNGGKTPIEYAHHSPVLMALLKGTEAKQSKEKNPVEEMLPELDKAFSEILDHYTNLTNPSQLTDTAYFKLSFPYPEAPPSIVRQTLSRLLPSAIPLPSSPFIYQKNTNDFGVEIKDLLFVNPSSWSIHSIPLHMDHIIQDLSRIANFEGFKLTFTKIGYYPRDRFIWTPTGVTTFARPSSRQLWLAIERSSSKAAYFGESAAFCARVRFFLGHMGSAADKKHFQDIQQFSSFREPKLMTYIEGGNLFTLTNIKGERKILIGQDHLAQMHACLRLERYFDFNPPTTLDSPLSPDTIRMFAEEMYAMDFLYLPSMEGEKSGYISTSMLKDVFSEFYEKKDVDRLTFRKIAIEKGLNPFYLEDQHLMKEVKPLVEEYVAQRRTLKQALAEEFDVTPQDLHFIPQAAYHLDIFMQPGPRGSIFLHDFSLCIRILELLQNTDTFLALHLCPDDRFLLTRYLATAQQLEKELGPLLIEARNELERAGFIIIPTPGLFFDQNYQLEDRTYHLNFLNAVTGWSEKQNRYFYITTGASAGTRLGTLLMQLFSMFLKQYEPNLEVYFTGKNPDKENDFSQAMALWNQIEGEQLTQGLMAGIHCLSIEKETRSHKHLSC